jgi:hypothetical protein
MNRQLLLSAFMCVVSSLIERSNRAPLTEED